MEELKIGDVILFYSKQRRLFRKSKLVFDEIGILINVWGVLYLYIPGDDPFPWKFDGKFPLPNVKVISPKKPYTKEEQNKLSKAVIEIESNDLKPLEEIVALLNYVRPKTFQYDIPTPITLTDIETNRYYKIVVDLEK